VSHPNLLPPYRVGRAKRRDKKEKMTFEKEKYKKLNKID